MKNLEDAIDYTSMTENSLMNLTKDTKDLSSTMSRLDSKMM